MHARFSTQRIFSYLFRNSYTTSRMPFSNSFTPLTKKYIKPLSALIGGGIVKNVYSLKNTEETTVKSIPINSITPLELLPAVYENMKTETWPKGYPVPIDGLAYIKVHYWGFDNKLHEGALIVNKDVAEEVLEIFCNLYKAKFPIESMLPIHKFNNDDDASMEANNTSAFNCRAITGKPGIFSQHSYGRAIDLNPLTNPYVKGDLVLPKNAKKPHEFKAGEPGQITPDSLAYMLFCEKGWDWGGHWKDLKDYQHFEKREGGEKRDPQGLTSRKRG